MFAGGMTDNSDPLKFLATNQLRITLGKSMRLVLPKNFPVTLPTKLNRTPASKLAGGGWLFGRET